MEKKIKDSLEENMAGLVILIVFLLAAVVGLLTALLVAFHNTNDILQDILTELKWR
jgi:hypothetical protein